MHALQRRDETLQRAFSVDRNGYHIRWDAVPAWVCDQCSEPCLESGEVARIQRALAALDGETEAA